MHEDAIETLRVFVEKVERLQALSLVRTLVEKRSSVKFSWTAESGALEMNLTGPDAEQVEAFVLTMRLFMQDNDRISIRRVSGLYENLPISEDLKRYFAMNRANLNQSLDRTCMIAINGDHPTLREILETVLYGQLSHLTETHRQRYRAWVEAPLARGMIDFEFVGVLVLFLRTLAAMAEINRRAVAELERANSPGADKVGGAW